MKKEKLAPLAGVKVIDFTIYVAAPAATSIFGYLGADVIKVEPPKGDPYRATGAGFGLPITAEENPLYDTVNFCKRDICLNLRTDEGKQVMRRLIEQADIFMTNYREKALEGMGLTYEEVKTINPRIVYGKGDGYGELGADAARPGFDATAFFARSGFAEEAAPIGGAPALTPSGAGDVVTSLGLGMGVLAAYVKALQTGEGSKVKTSLYTSGLWALASPIVRRQYHPRGNVKPTKGYLAITCDFPCAGNTWVRFCGMVAERYWADFCKALGLDEYAEDPRFATSAAQSEHASECYWLMADKLKEKRYEEWEPIFRRYDLPYEKIMGVAESVRDPQALANGYSCLMNYGEREIYLPMPPVQVSGVETGVRAPAAALGADTVQILKDFKFSNEEIEQLVSGNVVRQA